MLGQNFHSCKDRGKACPALPPHCVAKASPLTDDLLPLFPSAGILDTLSDSWFGQRWGSDPGLRGGCELCHPSAALRGSPQFAGTSISQS